MKKRFLMIPMWGRLYVLAVLTANLSGCGEGCSFLNRMFSEPQCEVLSLEATKTPLPLNAACLGQVNSRKVRINCPASAGTHSQCTAISTGATVTAIVVPDNANGKFLDGNGKTYSSCGDLITDLNSPTVILRSIAGIFVSSATGLNSLVCDSAGCILNGTSDCMSGWDNTQNPPAPSSAAANLPGGVPYLTCVYIDNGSPPPLSVGSWSGPMPKLVITTNNLHFTSGWTDAFTVTP